jgi:predicted nucleic acid-binding Zn ribbon protein
MPTYEYECRECGRLKLKRLIGKGSGIIFKGSGFYETDYKRKEQ